MSPKRTVFLHGVAALRTPVACRAGDLKRTRIRINIVSPGATNTQSLRVNFSDPAEEGLTFPRNRSPIGPIGEPGEIADVAAGLASDAGCCVNGVEPFADGGASQT